MEENIKRIFNLFGTKLVCSMPMKLHVCAVLNNMPEDIIEVVTQTCWFMGSMEDAWAFTFTGNDLKDQHLIFLSDALLIQNEIQIHFSIAHEIGHIIYSHRNSVLVKQSKEEIALQEKQADDFAKEYTITV